MKPSPLQLNWVTYPSASFAVIDTFKGAMQGGDKVVSGEVTATVKYSPNGDHYAFLQVKSRQDDDDASSPYKFDLTVVAAFAMDLEVARREYRPASTKSLVPLVAVNVCRILYSGAREYLAMMTSRATYGTAVLDSVLLEPVDVSIESDLAPPELIESVFGATPQEVAELRAMVEKSEKPDSGRSESEAPKRKGKREKA